MKKEWWKPPILRGYHIILRSSHLFFNIKLLLYMDIIKVIHSMYMYMHKHVDYSTTHCKFVVFL